MADIIKRALRRRAAVEPVIGHLKAEHRTGRNYLAKPAGDAVNAGTGAVGYSFRLLLAWLAVLFAAVTGDTRRNVAREANPMGLRALIASATQTADQDSSRTTT